MVKADQAALTGIRSSTSDLAHFLGHLHALKLKENRTMNCLLFLYLDAQELSKLVVEEIVIEVMSLSSSLRGRVEPAGRLQQRWNHA